MRLHPATMLGLAALGVATGLTAQKQGDPVAELSYKAAKKWSIVLPNETWTSVDAGIPIPHENGESFAAVREGLSLSLSVDTDGDGRTDQKVKGAKGFLVLKAKDRDGESMAYAVRFKVESKAYKFSSAGMMRGRVNGTPVMLIDQNNNGLYNEIGTDAMVVGKSRSASYLSSVVNLGGSLFSIEVAPNGKSIEATPFAGEAGKLNLAKGFKASGKLTSAVVRSQDGKMSFQMAGSDDMLVPAGTYTIASGRVSKASESADIKAGKMPPIEVAAGRETAVQWGGPLLAELAFSHKGENVNIEPSSVHYYGKSGEEYVNFLPQGASPKFMVYDERTKKLLKTGRFGT